MTEENEKICVCCESVQGRYQCYCGNWICRECVDDPTSPASNDWHETARAVCSYACEEKEIDYLVDQIDKQHILLDRLRNDLDKVCQYAECAKTYLQDGDIDTAASFVCAILARQMTNEMQKIRLGD